MKKIMMGLIFLASTQALATSENCVSNLLGTYSCEFQGNDVELKIKEVSPANTIDINIAGEGGVYTVDGELNQSMNDDSEYIAKCGENNSLNIENYFNGKLSGSVSILKNAEQLLYTIQKSSGKLSLQCFKLN